MLMPVTKAAPVATSIVSPRRVSPGRLRRGVVVRAEASEDTEPVPPGCARYAVELKKPFGMYLANDANGNIFVEEIVPGGAADKCGLIGVGDRLIATSAIVFNSEMDYGGVSVKKGEEQIRFATRGESFDTVMAAISTWPAPRKMKLEFQRCE
jgi:S1-C subfamily serine protease